MRGCVLAGIVVTRKATTAVVAAVLSDIHPFAMRLTKPIRIICAAGGAVAAARTSSVQQTKLNDAFRVTDAA